MVDIPKGFKVVTPAQDIIPTPAQDITPSPVQDIAPSQIPSGFRAVQTDIVPSVDEPATIPSQDRGILDDFTKGAAFGLGPGPIVTALGAAIPGEDILDAFTKGMFFGTGPIISAGEAAIVGRKPGGGLFDIGNFEGTFEQRFDEALAAERTQNEAFREQNPAITTAAEVGGSLAGLFVAPGATLTRFGGRTAAGQLTAAAAEGAAIGVGFATGEGTDISQAIIEGAAFGTGGRILAKGIQSVAGGVANFAKGADLLAKSPTLTQLREKTSALYDRARKSGVKFKEQEFTEFADGLNERILEQGARPGLTDKTIAVLKEITDLKGTAPDFRGMDELRRIAQIAASAVEPSERRLGSMIIIEIDEFVESGSSVLGATAKEARQLWGRVRRDELVAGAIERAKENVSGIDQGLRVELRKILTNPKKARGFSEAEKKAMKQIVRGTNTSNALRAIGKLGFSVNRAIPNVVGGAAGVAAGGIAGGVPGIVAGQAAAIGSRVAAEALQSRNARILGAMVRAGKSEGQISGVAQALSRIGDDERAFQAIVRSAGVAGQ